MMGFLWKVSLLYGLTLILTCVLGEDMPDTTNDEKSVIDLQELLGNVLSSLNKYREDMNKFKEDLNLIKETVSDKHMQLEQQNISGSLLLFREELNAVKHTVADKLTKWEEHILSSSLNTIRQDLNNVKDSVFTELAQFRSKDISSSLDSIRHGLIEIGKCANQNPLLQQTLNGMTEKVLTRLDKVETQVTGKIGSIIKEPVRLRHCADVYDHFPQRTGDGVYTIHPQDLGQFEVYCDMTTDGGGWTVFQKRGDFVGVPADNFLRNWQEFKEGFGDFKNEFWLGLDKLSSMTKNGNYELRVDLAENPLVKKYAKYLNFKVQDESNKYRLSFSNFVGNAGDSLQVQNGMKFSTPDQDNDIDSRHCAKFFSGSWWHSNCHKAHLNGLNLKGEHKLHGKGIEWYTWKGAYFSLSRTEMKFRPQGWKPKSKI